MNRNFFWLIVLLLNCFGCGKEFLEVKVNAHSVIPVTIEDYQKMLDHGEYFMNSDQAYRLSLVGSDEYTISQSTWNALRQTAPIIVEKYSYIWHKDPYMEHTGHDWNYAYSRILHANIVLDGLSRIRNIVNIDDFNSVKGGALFFRAYNYYQLAQLFCYPYDNQNADKLLGLPLRIESDLTLHVDRSTLKQTYNQIENDLLEASRLLPDQTSIKLRPSKSATFGLLARLYLHMKKYDEAEKFANLALSINDNLINYNDLDKNLIHPFEPNFGLTNSEVIFAASGPNIYVFHRNRIEVDGALLNLYENGDLRRSIYYKENTAGNIFYAGSYQGNVLPFVGISTSELYLIRAECNIRNGNISQARFDLNMLAKNRFIDGKIPDYLSKDEDLSLMHIYDERRRELAFRGLRWEDLRRFGKDFVNGGRLTRTLGNQNYSISIDSLIWPLPPDVIRIGKYTQNN